MKVHIAESIWAGVGEEPSRENKARDRFWRKRRHFEWGDALLRIVVLFAIRCNRYTGFPSATEGSENFIAWRRFVKIASFLITDAMPVSATTPWQLLGNDNVLFVSLAA